MFEMLGGLLVIISKEAINWAWELLKVYKIKENLYVSVFEGNPEKMFHSIKKLGMEELIDETELFLKQERQLLGNGIKDLVDRVQKFTLTFVQQRRKL
jgi:hypothetical protein